jgi:hypothetical protein
MQLVSLDGFIETSDHQIDWTAPGPELQQVILDDARKVTGFLHGRRTYDLMASVWPTADAFPLVPPRSVPARKWVDAGVPKHLWHPGDRDRSADGRHFGRLRLVAMRGPRARLPGPGHRRIALVLVGDVA